MTIIKRVILDGNLAYDVKHYGDCYQHEIFTSKQMYELLEDIIVIAAHPYVVERTRTLELGRRSNVPSKNVYSIDTDGWLFATSSFTLKELIEIYKTAQLLTKYNKGWQ